MTKTKFPSFFPDPKNHQPLKSIRAKNQARTSEKLELQIEASKTYQPLSLVRHLLDVLGTQATDSLSSPPDLEVINLLQLLVVLLTVIGLRVVL
jgi:hypothetical protein